MPTFTEGTLTTPAAAERARQVTVCCLLRRRIVAATRARAPHALPLVPVCCFGEYPRAARRSGLPARLGCERVRA